MGIDYTFVGWVSRDERRVLDEHGKVVGKPKPGDSMITEDILDPPALVGSHAHAHHHEEDDDYHDHPHRSPW